MFVAFIKNAIRFSTIFLFGSTGEIITEKSGHLNMGTPGIMCLGGIGAVLGERLYLLTIANDVDLINPFLCVLFPLIMTIIFGALGGLFFSFLTVTLRCNQNVVGLTLTTFGVGLNAFILARVPRGAGFTYASVYFYKLFPDSLVNGTGWFGEIFLSQSWFTYLGIAVAIATAIIISKTKVGLNLRAVGENAAAADSAGINVNAYRYIATIIGGAIAGIGGAFYELDKTKGMFNIADGIDAFGWLALCIVIFSMWKPLFAIFASFGFACLSILPSFVTGNDYITYGFKMLPYVATLFVLIITSVINSKKAQAPASLGVTYFREDR
jgi:simple sugar transport system permease protein